MSFVFADRGAWHGWSYRDDRGVELVDLSTGISQWLPHRGELALADDRIRIGPLEIRFRDLGTSELRGAPAEWTVRGPFALEREGDLLLCRHRTGPTWSGYDLAGLPRTLRWNFRAPHGDLRHAGVVPSPRAYPGLWAWDSWKHATVLPRALAREQILAMLDHQRPNGRIPDTVRFDARDNFWGCAKPPLLAWACSHHEGFLEEFADPIRRYLGWWERERRPPGERFLAYGGDDLEKSKWESGWDDASRYDEIEMRGELQSLLSVDLNAYWLREKCLAGAADPALEREFERLFFHAGAFRDIAWPEHVPTPHLTAATWIPLWCGLGTPAQRAAIVRLLLDPDHFDTPMPFPTVARSDPRFDPHGYWRGPVWLDHAAWAVEVLVAEGETDRARAAAERLLAAPPDWENYDPLTGEPATGPRPAVPQFSWSACARVWLENAWSAARSTTGARRPTSRR